MDKLYRRALTVLFLVSVQMVQVVAQDFTVLWSSLPGSGYTVVGDVNRDGYLDVIRNDRWLSNSIGTSLGGAVGIWILNPISGILAVADIDNDGDLDVSESGSISTTRLTKLWTNSPPPAVGLLWFNSAPVNGLQGYMNAALSWADYDQDGDVDFFLAGFTNTPNFNAIQTRTYRNDGHLNFTRVTTSLPNLADAAMAWADFNRDGTLDLCVAGRTNIGGNPVTLVLTNDGTGGLADSQAGLLGMTSSTYLTSPSIEVGDVDNDGWPDILMTGYFRLGSVNTNLCKIYRNSGVGVFTEFATLPPLNLPEAHFVDFNNDGRLDVLVSGRTFGVLPDAVVKVYLNQGGGAFLDSGFGIPLGASGTEHTAVGDLDGDSRVELIIMSKVYKNNFPNANTPPEAPTGLAAVVTPNSVVLSWLPATDAEQSGGLTYNLRIGTAPGLGDVMSALADSATGRRWVVQSGNASESLQWRLRQMPVGTNYWSVQAIDHAFAGSAFAAEQTFVVADPRPRFVSINKTNDTVYLEVDFGWPGRYSLETSSALPDWTPAAPTDYGAGRTNISIPVAKSPLFFRFRGE